MSTNTESSVIIAPTALIYILQQDKFPLKIETIRLSRRETAYQGI